MKNNDLMRVWRVKQTLYLSLQKRNKQEAGWTAKELADSCNADLPTIRTFISALVRLGYLKRVDRGLYAYAKHLSLDNLSEQVKHILINW